jgi:nitroreductase
MAFSDLVATRYSVRKYQAKKVEKEKLQVILEAGRVAPSAHNIRPIKMIVVQEEEGLDKVKKAANAYGAPLLIIVCGDTKMAAVRPADGKSMMDVDTSIVTDHMMLQAYDLGLGTCWIGAFDPEIIKEEFHIPDHLEPINLLAVGYASGEPISIEAHDKKRKPIEDIVAYETL